MPDMLTSIATVSLGGTLREKFEAISRAGFSGIEIFENDLLSFSGDAYGVRHMAEDFGLKIVTVQPFRDFEGMPEPHRSRAFDRAEHKFDLMEKLGTDLFFACSNVSPLSLGGINRAVDDLYELGERAAKRGFRVGYEALAWGKHISDYRDAWEVVRRVDHPAVGIVLDSFHILSLRLDLKVMRAIPGERIFLVQLADAPTLDMNVLSWSRHYRCFPGQGRLPIQDFMRALAATNYDGPLSLEIFNDYFRTAAPAQIASDGYRSLIHLTEGMDTETHKTFSFAPKAPPRVHYDGVEFIEFVANRDAVSDLEKILTQLGFQNRGWHRSKKVNLWTQGAINLVLNSEHKGFAHDYLQSHGTSICAMGLRVDNAQQAHERALAYGCTSNEQAIGPGELLIPGVRTIKDSLVYFIDRYGARGSIWNVDFRLLQDDSVQVASAGLLAIDHIGQIAPIEQMSSWALLYKSVFGFDAAPQFDIPDPSGLMQSQVIESAAREIRVTLNAAQGRGTLAARFITQYAGSGIQHIAFSTNDIFATLQKLKANGIPMLIIPPMYYDDLEARFGLDQALMAQLRANNVLYDQSNDGAFFQAYTQSLDNRIFFEIVERRGYQDYGAANAPVRIAAQTEILKSHEKFMARLEM